MPSTRPGVAAFRWRRALLAFWLDERGQDLIEYALLTASVGLAGAATWPVIEEAIGAAYRALDTNTQNLWEPPPPSGGG